MRPTVRSPPIVTVSSMCVTWVITRRRSGASSRSTTSRMTLRGPAGIAVLLTAIGAQPANQVLGHGVDYARRRLTRRHPPGDSFAYRVRGRRIGQARRPAERCDWRLDAEPLRGDPDGTVVAAPARQ